MNLIDKVRYKWRFETRNIRKQIAATIFLVVFGILMMIFSLNKTLLSRVYMYDKYHVMQEAFQLLDKNSEDGEIYTEDFYTQLETTCAKYNLSIVIMSPNGEMVLATARDYDRIISQMYMLLFDDSVDENLTYNGEKFTIKRFIDSRNSQAYLVLWGSLSDGNVAILRSTIASMEESANVTNRFLLIVGIIGIFMSFVFANKTARILTRPIKELDSISEKMANLDFNAKYEPRNPGNEIDSLGVRMNEMSEKLEHTIHDLKFANAELQKDLELRDRNEKMRKEFLSNVSHELKTPIAVIQGYAEGLAEGVIEDKESQQYYCEVIVDEAKRMNKMVKQMLSLNQIEYGENHLNMEHIDLGALVKGVVSANNILAEKSEVSIIVEPFSDVTVWADEFFTEQVLTNYITNGIHYAKYDKQVRIKVTDRGGDVRVSVFNTGDPIPEESIDRIWEKFYKVDKARTREYGGSGIGLSVVKAVMDSFGKQCGVTNYENGVEFWFELDK